MANKEEKKVKVSPVGIAVYPHLTNPNRKFNQDGVYCVDLELEPTAENKQFLVELTKEMKEKYPKGHLPYKKQVSQETEQPTGNILVTFKSSYAPKLFDQYGEKIADDVIIGSGSVIQVAFIPNLYEIAKGNCGMNLYLQAVIVRDLKEYQSRDAVDYGFSVENKKEVAPEDMFNESSDTPPDEPPEPEPNDMFGDI